MELAFAALHQVCAPALDCVERLPAPQRDALPAERPPVLTDDPRQLLTSALPGRWTIGSPTGSSLRRGAIRWLCWSCRAGSRRRTGRRVRVPGVPSLGVRIEKRS
jgi:hypothetical protein